MMRTFPMPDYITYRFIKFGILLALVLLLLGIIAAPVI
jgi:hypothetical protein